MLKVFRSQVNCTFLDGVRKIEYGTPYVTTELDRRRYLELVIVRVKKHPEQELKVLSNCKLVICRVVGCTATIEGLADVQCYHIGLVKSIHYRTTGVSKVRQQASGVRSYIGDRGRDGSSHNR